jgi:hypothetical protein
VFMGRMIDQTGLNERLQQHSQRSGMMIGVSMAAVVVLLVGSFTWLFFRLDPFFSDFAGRTGVDRSTVEPVRIAASPRAGTPGADTGLTPLPIPPTPTALLLTPVAGVGTPQFQATHVIADFGQQVNFRAAPGTGSTRVALLPPGTRLRFLNEQETVGDVVWMHFQLERGEVGWVRQLDVTAIRPGTPGPTPTVTPSRATGTTPTPLPAQTHPTTPTVRR